jgi:hypothetical protein
MDYFFKYNSLMRAEVYDIDNLNGDVTDQRLIGCVVFSTHALVTSPDGTLLAPLVKVSHCTALNLASTIELKISATRASC